MARIHHIGIWTNDIDRLAGFYGRYFGTTAGPRYLNSAKGFESAFLTLAGGAKLELMRTSTLSLSRVAAGTQPFGLAHVAVEVGSTAAVDALAGRLRTDGYPVLDGPRRTGDGYYEAVVLDPDGNRVEICAAPANT